MSAGLANRYAFEALGHDLDLGELTTTVPSMSMYRETAAYSLSGITGPA